MPCFSLAKRLYDEGHPLSTSSAFRAFLLSNNHAMQSQIWASTIPLYIIHPSSPIPYLIQVPRLSYLPLLLPRLTSFFGPSSSFSYQGILLKNLPVGLLFDLYQPELPWRLELGDGPLFDIHDTYINSVKEVGRSLVTCSTFLTSAG